MIELLVQARSVKVGDYVSSPMLEGTVTSITDMQTGILLFELDPGGMFPVQVTYDLVVQRPGDATLESEMFYPSDISRGIPSSAQLRRRMVVDVGLPDDGDDGELGRAW